MLSPLNPRETRPKPRKDLGTVADELKKDVVEPLQTSVLLTNTDAAVIRAASQGAAVQTRGQLEQVATEALSPSMRGLSRGLGVTGGALGGVAGLNQVVQGLKEGDETLALSGAADVATSANALATLGLIGGAAVLGPASTVLVGMRGLHMMQADGRASHLSAGADLLTAAMFASRLLHAPGVVPMALGAFATTVGALKGLHTLRQGQEHNDERLRIRGTGEAITALGVALVSTGHAFGPGVGIILAGAGLPLLDRVKMLQPVLHPVAEWTTRTLYPVSVKTDSTLDHFAPAMTAAQKGAKVLEPITEPLADLGHLAFEQAQKGVQWAARTFPREPAAADLVPDREGPVALPSPSGGQEADQTGLT